MKLIELSENDKGLYNHFVAAQESGSFLQSFEWGEWQARLGRAAYRFKIEDLSGNWLGVIQLVKMPLFGSKYYLYAPYGPVGDLRFQIEDLRFLVQELQKKFPGAVFIRIEPKMASLTSNLSPLASKSANIQPAKTLIINLEKTEEQLLLEMRSKTRYNVKVAQKHGVEVKEELEISIGHGIYFKEALDLICDTAKRQGFMSQSFDYYKSLLDFFVLNKDSDVKAHLYKAIYQNQLLAAAIMVDFGHTRTFLFGGSSDLNKNVMAPYLMHFKAMMDAKNQNLSFYDFWGIETASGETPGFVKFKLGFGGEEKEYAGAYDIVIGRTGYKVYKFLRAINKITKKF